LHVARGVRHISQALFGVSVDSTGVHEHIVVFFRRWFKRGDTLDVLVVLDQAIVVVLSLTERLFFHYLFQGQYLRIALEHFYFFLLLIDLHLYRICVYLVHNCNFFLQSDRNLGAKLHYLRLRDTCTPPIHTRKQTPTDIVEREASVCARPFLSEADHGDEAGIRS
jgi:hypothetical protein